MSKELLEKIKGKLTEEEFTEVSNYINKQVVALGTDEAFALTDTDGEIRAFKQRVRLSAADGTLIQPVPNGPFVISAQGYEALTEASGTVVVFPDKIHVHGQPQANPYVDRDITNGRTLAVHARAVAFRFSSKGIPQVCDWSTMFDCPSYRMIDLLAKAKKFKGAFKLLPIGAKPDGASNWAKYSFDEATNLWLNTDLDEVLDWYGQIINREKKAIDFAQTFARRNAVKHLLGLQKAPGPVWDVTILCWRPTEGSIVKWDMTTYKTNVLDRVAQVIQGTGSFMQRKITQGADHIEDNLDRASVDTELAQADDKAQDMGDFIDITPEPVAQGATAALDLAPAVNEDVADTAKNEPASPPSPPMPKTNRWKLSAAEQSIMANYEFGKKSWPALHARALKETGIKASQITPALAEKVWSKINNYLDQGEEA
jgi:hypothetical protein